MNSPQKICHLIWQLISGQVAITRNMVRRNMHVITTAQDVESQKKMLLMRSSNAHWRYKHEHYHQHPQALKPSLSRVTTPT